MSWFTAEAKGAQPTCPRCKTSDFTALIKRGELHDVFDCRKCGPIVPKVKAKA